MEKRTRLAVVLMVLGFLPATPLIAQETTAPPDTDKPYVGVRLNARPIPSLLSKHLQLDKGRGLLIENIQNDSPADKAGLDKDDIIISFQKDPVTNYDDFVKQVSQSQVDQEISLEIIHLGEKKTVTLKLGSYATFAQRADTNNWKYPVATPKMYRLDPGEELWREVPLTNNDDVLEYLLTLNHRTYAFRDENDLEYTVTVEGDPFKNNANILVKDGEEEFHTTANALGQLPEKYLPAVKNALETARFAAPGISPLAPPPSQFLAPQPYLYRVPQDDAPRTQRRFEELQDEVAALRERLQQMEDLVNRLLGEPTEPTPNEEPSTK